MHRSLPKCQFVAFGSGILLIGLLLGASILFRALFEPLTLTHSLWGSVLTQSLLFIPPVAFACAVATYARRYDKVAFLTTGLPILGFFLVLYLLDITTFIESSAMHAMTGGALGYISPFNVIGQISRLFLPLLWAFLTGLAGIGISRYARRHTPVQSDEQEVRSGNSFRWFTMSFAVLLVACVLAYAGHVKAQVANERFGSNMTIREILEKFKAELDEHSDYMPKIAPALYQEPSARKMNGVLGLYRVWPWSPSQRKTLDTVLERIIHGVPQKDVLLNIQNIEWSHSSAAQAAALRNLANSAAPSPPLGLYVYFLKYGQDAPVKYAAMYGLSESQLNQAPPLPAYATFLQNPQPTIDEWQDYVSAHMIPCTESLNRYYPADPYKLELACSRQSLQVGESSQLALYVRSVIQPSTEEKIQDESRMVSGSTPQPIPPTNIAYEPKTPGIKTLGPFEVDFQGKRLKSNTITVEVTDRWPSNEEKQDVRIFPRKVPFGSPIRVIYRQQYCRSPSLPTTSKDPKTGLSPQWHYQAGQSWKEGDRNFHKDEWWFDIPTTKTGKVLVTRSDLPNLPQDVPFETTEVEISNF